MSKHVSNKRPYSEYLEDELTDGTKTLILAHGTAAAPAIGFASPNQNTGIFHGTGSDSVDFTVAGTKRAHVSDTDLRLVDAIVLANNDGTAAAPAYTFRSDTNTGIYRSGADTIDFSAGGTQRASLTTTGFTSTVPRLNSDGAVGAPGISFSADTDTGIYRIGANNIGVACGGSKRLDIGASSNVVVGNTTFDDGTSAAPSINFSGATNTGLTRSAGGRLQLVTTGTVRLSAGSNLDCTGVTTTSSTSNTTGGIVTTSIGLNGTTDAVSSTNGGGMTIAGGVGIAKKLFVGTEINTASTTATTSNTTGSITTAGGIASSNTTDATSSTNGGTLTLAGGAGIAKKLFVGTNIDAAGTTATTSSSTGTITTAGGISSSNTTDASSNTNGGSLTLAGGAAIAKKLYVGTDVNVAGVIYPANTGLSFGSGLNYLASNSYAVVKVGKNGSAATDFFTVSQTTSFRVERVNSHVTLSMKGFSGTVDTSTTIEFNTTIASDFRPSETVYFIVPCNNSSGDRSAVFTIDSTGVLKMQQKDYGTFTAGDTVAVQTTSMTYQLNY